MTTINLSNQASFIDFFTKFAAGDISNGDTIEFEQPIEYQEYPFLLIEGEGYNGTINASVMRALVIHQRNINRLYSLITYGKVQRLKLADAKALQISFRVSEGSLKIRAEDIDRVSKLILSKLNSKQVTLAVIVIAVAGLGFYFSTRPITPEVIIHYIDEYFDLKRMELKHKQDLEKMGIVHEQDIEKMKLKHGQDLEKMELGNKIILNNVEKVIDGDQEFSNELNKLKRQGGTVKYLGDKIPPATTKRKSKK